MKQIFSILALFLLLVSPAFSQSRFQLRSPDGHLVFSFALGQKAAVYRLSYKGQVLIEDSPLSLSFKNAPPFGSGLKKPKATFRTVDKHYPLIVGKTSKVRNHFREALVPLIEKGPKGRRVDLRIRAFNDGLAFRYEFPMQKNWDQYSLSQENTSFRLNGDPMVTSLLFEQYQNAHEGPYEQKKLSKIPEDKLLDLPALIEFPGKTYMAITEANLRDYAGMYLRRNKNRFISDLSSLPGEEQVKVKAQLPHQSPWRVMLTSDRIGALLESNILTSLNEDPAITDFSWIKPGKTTFHWWNGDVVPDSNFTPGVNFETNKYYIDFCARNGIDYHAVIGYDGAAWYRHDGTNYSNAGIDSGLIEPQLDMQRVGDYARKKGVGIHVWVHWKAIYPRLDENFVRFKRWNIKGMMVDFMNRDDQEMVNIQEEILQAAARHQLYIQFHGVFKPTGLSRTYPNEFTREGTRNYEVNKWDPKGLSPDHDLTIAFTRLLAGATDYHLGGFRAVPPSEFKAQYKRPLMLGTRCHMLAMYVVLESYLGSLCDYPAAYEGETGFDFIREVPTTWDETRVLQAEFGEYLCIARRSDKTWYVGAINNSKARTIELPLDFLPDGDYEGTIYSDPADAEQHPNKVKMETTQLNSSSRIRLKLAAGGGQVMRLSPH